MTSAVCCSSGQWRTYGEFLISWGTSAALFCGRISLRRRFERIRGEPSLPAILTTRHTTRPTDSECSTADSYALCDRNAWVSGNEDPSRKQTVQREL